MESDKALQRAVIQKMQPNGCGVEFIDLWNSARNARLRELDISDKRLNADVQSLVRSEHVLNLNVIPSENQMRQCELHTENGQNMLDIEEFFE